MQQIRTFQVDVCVETDSAASHTSNFKQDNNYMFCNECRDLFLGMMQKFFTR